MHDEPPDQRDHDADATPGPITDIATGLDSVLCRAVPTGYRLQLAFMDEATNTHHCRGTKIIPFSMRNADEVLGDLDLNIAHGRLPRMYRRGP